MVRRLTHGVVLTSRRAQLERFPVNGRGNGPSGGGAHGDDGVEVLVLQKGLGTQHAVQG